MREIPKTINVTADGVSKPDDLLFFVIETEAAVEALRAAGFKVLALRAEPGDIVTCENGHEICQVIVPIHEGDGLLNGFLGNWKQAAPRADQKVDGITCTHLTDPATGATCGAKWVRGTSARRQLHFAVGWR